MRAILRMMVKGFLMSFVVFGLFVVAANAQSGKKKFVFKLDKSKISFVTPIFEVSNGTIVVSGVVKGVEVSGGRGGCTTVTVTTYRFVNGEKIPVRSVTKQICKVERLPEIVIDQIPRGKYLVEIEVDRPLIEKENLRGEITIKVESEKINVR